MYKKTFFSRPRVITRIDIGLDYSCQFWDDIVYGWPLSKGDVLHFTLNVKTFLFLFWSKIHKNVLYFQLDKSIFINSAPLYLSKHNLEVFI